MLRKLQPNKVALLLASMLVVQVVVSGCSKKNQAPSQPAPVQKPPAAAKVVPPQKQMTSAGAGVTAAPQLDFSNKKDPFKPFAVVQQQPAQKPAHSNVNRVDLLPIQSYDTSKFRVSGIIVGLKENKALVIDPAGKGYVVKEGMLIGSNDGYISKITSTSLEVVETYREDTGHLRKKTIKLTLPQKK